ncbi:MAG: RHS repeat-associated core domain-containing protein [Desulfobacteraceae bacterium]|jgi:RHS repeat-associated protein|nr:MAG: RHS repeat-associated core domain-containing protein [Desulfobacteraceae bacterium]
MVVDADNVVVWAADHEPFGKAEVNVNSTIINNLRFPGQYYDAETGLHYNWHRYYDPDTGRYLTPDPIGLAGGINPFVYSENNPVNLIDPWGLKTWR